MQPVRKVISATHFKPIQSSSSSGWTPCSPGDPNAVEKTWSDVDSDDLVEPPLKLADFIKSLENVRPTVTEADIKRHDDWTKESGMLFVNRRHTSFTDLDFQETTAHNFFFRSHPRFYLIPLDFMTARRPSPVIPFLPLHTRIPYCSHISYYQ